MFLDRLFKITENCSKEKIFLCIRDLAENGPCLERFLEGERTPSRHELTLFLATWFRWLGLEPEDYKNWLIDYSVDVLSRISSTKISQIRHSTKSTIKYVHRSEVPFVCNCEDNIFKAACSKDCPLYSKMKADYLKRLKEEKKRLEELAESSKPKEPDPENLPVRKRYKKQYEEAVSLVKEYLDKGYRKKDIAPILNQKGYKTKTGHVWTANYVSNTAREKGWSPKRTRKKKG